MEKSNNDPDITTNQFLEKFDLLIGQPLLYIVKSPGMLFFDLGFGEKINDEGKPIARETEENDNWVGSFAIHVDCPLAIIDKAMHTKKWFQYDDTNDLVQEWIHGAIECKVDKVALCEYNKLKIDIGSKRIVIVPWEGNDESWRFFKPRTDSPHIIGSAESIEI